MGKTERPHCMLAPATPTITGFTAREISTTHQIAWAGSLNPQIARTPPFKIPPVFDIKGKERPKNHQLFLAISWAYS